MPTIFGRLLINVTGPYRSKYSRRLRRQTYRRSRAHAGFQLQLDCLEDRLAPALLVETVPIVAVYTGGGQSATVATQFTSPFQVLVTNQGVPLANATVTFTAATGSATGTFNVPGSGASSTDTVTTNSSGIATADPFVASNFAGTYTITASTQGAQTPADFQETNVPGTPTSIQMLNANENNQSAQAGFAFGQPLQVLVTDQYGNAVSGVPVTFSVPSGGASADFFSLGNTLAPSSAQGTQSVTVLTDNTGTAGVTMVANLSTGQFTVSAALGYPASGLQSGGGGLSDSLFSQDVSVAQIGSINLSGALVPPVQFTETNTAAPSATNGQVIVPGFDQFAVQPGDGTSSGAVTLPFTLNFGGQAYSSLYVNNNGNVTFDQPLSFELPNLLASLSLPTIAPFLANVYTLGNSGVVHYGVGTYDGQLAFGVEWPMVSYYRNANGSGANQLNDFQLLIVDRSDTNGNPEAVGDNFDIIMNYGQVSWETGDLSGGTSGLGGASAAVGYIDGSGDRYQLPGSNVSGSFLDTSPTGLVDNSLNSSVPGRYVFEIRTPEAPPTMDPISDQIVNQGSTLSLQVPAHDPAEQGLTYSILDGPQGASINADGLLTWTPGSPSAVPVAFTVEAAEANNPSLIATQTFYVTVQTQPSVSQDPVSQDIQAGRKVTFIAAANGNPAPTVQWQYSTDGTNWINIQGANSDTYQFVANQSESGDLYRALFTNAVTSVPSDPATLTVYTPTIASLAGEVSPASGSAYQLTISQGQTVPLGEGDTLNLSGTVLSADPNDLPLSWTVNFGDGTIQSSQQNQQPTDSASFTLPAHQYSSIQNYIVTVTVVNDDGTQESFSFLADVLTGEQSNDVNQSAGTTIQTGNGSMPSHTQGPQAQDPEGNSVEVSDIALTNSNAVQNPGQPITVTVVGYNSDPTSQQSQSSGSSGGQSQDQNVNVFGAGGSTQSSATPQAFFDVRGDNLGDGATLTLTFTVKVDPSAIETNGQIDQSKVNSFNAYYWNGTSWESVMADPADPTVNTALTNADGSLQLDSSGKATVQITVILTANSTPSVSQVNGTVFTVAVPVQSSAPDGPVGSPSVTTTTTTSISITPATVLATVPTASIAAGPAIATVPYSNANGLANVNLLSQFNRVANFSSDNTTTLAVRVSQDIDAGGHPAGDTNDENLPQQESAGLWGWALRQGLADSNNQQQGQPIVPAGNNGAGPGQVAPAGNQSDAGPGGGAAGQNGGGGGGGAAGQNGAAPTPGNAPADGQESRLNGIDAFFAFGGQDEIVITAPANEPGRALEIATAVAAGWIIFGPSGETKRRRTGRWGLPL